MKTERPGIAFEKAVAQVQAQFDPSATVSHNAVIEDRLGHRRQFDVVIRGSFSGQALLGVIECKDLKRKVGASEIDAFVTKSQDVNANLRLFMSRRGFTRSALQKCSHYGIQALSLLGHDPPNLKIILGTRWEADQIRWGRMAVTLRFVDEPSTRVEFKAEELMIAGRKVLDWFTNHLLAQEAGIKDFGWVVGVGTEFSTPQIVHLDAERAFLCRAIEFHAERVCEKFERVVAINGTGFYNWNSRQAMFPPGATITTEPVPMDFTQWAPVLEGRKPPPGFLTVRVITRAVQFEHVADAIDLADL